MNREIFLELFGVRNEVENEMYSDRFEKERASILEKENEKYTTKSGIVYEGKVILGQDDMDCVECPKCGSPLGYMDDMEILSNDTNFCYKCGCKLIW